jgi:hypothetical protein
MSDFEDVRRIALGLPHQAADYSSQSDSLVRDI